MCDPVPPEGFLTNAQLGEKINAYLVEVAKCRSLSTTKVIDSKFNEDGSISVTVSTTDPIVAQSWIDAGLVPAPPITLTVVAEKIKD